MPGPIPETWVVDPDTATAREVAPGMWRLRLPWTWDGIDHVNAYLLTDGDEHVLVDCGPAGHPTSLAALEGALRAAGVELDALDRVVLTHAHSDHLGQAPAIVARSGAEVWLHPGTEHVDAVLAEPERYAALRVRRARAEGVPEEALPWFADVREETDTIVERVRADHALGDGVLVPTPLGPLRVLTIPGHAPSQVALVQAERGFALLADAVCAVFSPYYDYGFTADPVGEALGSLDRIAGLAPVALALPGHGAPLTDLAAVVDEHRAGIAGALAAVRTAVEEAPAGAYDIALRAFGPAPSPFATFFRTNLAAGCLRHLRLRGDVVRTGQAEERFRYVAAATGPAASSVKPSKPFSTDFASSPKKPPAPPK